MTYDTHTAGPGYTSRAAYVPVAHGYQITAQRHDAGTSILVIQEDHVPGHWVVFSTADGYERIVSPGGAIFDGLLVDSRDATPASEMLAWLADQDF